MNELTRCVSFRPHLPDILDYTRLFRDEIREQLGDHLKEQAYLIVFGPVYDSLSPSHLVVHLDPK